MLLRREADLDAEDLFLPLALGVLSSLQRLDRVLAAEPVDAGHEGSPPRAEDRATVDLILGLVSLRNRLHAHLERESTEPCRPSSATAAPQPVRHPPLLR
jgi:hypothetical protein